MSVFGFQTPEELMLFLHRQMLAAQTAGREPIEVGFGDYWVRVVDFFPEVIPVFGYVMTLEELRETEDEMAIQMLVQMKERGFLYGRCYSEMCPEGELGDTAVNQVLMTITEDEFEAARQAGWQLLPLMLEGHEFASKVMQVAGLEP